MKKLTGLKRIKTAVFISGKGSNLKNLIKFSLTKKSPISIGLVISNNTKAKGLSYTKKFSIPKKIFTFKDQKNSEKNLLISLKNHQIKLICLAGFMQILSKNFLKSFSGKIINIHPSLLPKYKGLNTHKRVIDNGDKFAGCTVHYVSKKLDSGKIIIQKKIKVSPKDNVISLAKKVLEQEHKLYPAGIIKIFN